MSPHLAALLVPRHYSLMIGTTCYHIHSFIMVHQLLKVLGTHTHMYVRMHWQWLYSQLAVATCYHCVMLFG